MGNRDIGFAPKVLVLAVAAAAGAALLAVPSPSARAETRHPSAPLGFGHAVVVDAQRVAGEPSLAISPVRNAEGHHTSYVSAPWGFSTTASFVWKSADGGASFHLVPGQVPTGKPTTCAGGGDSGLAVDPVGNLYFVDLQGLTDVSASLSTDGGRTFTTTCNAANNTIVDRPWIATYGNPLTTGREYMTVDNVAQCTVNCGLGQAGSNMLELTQTSGTAAAAQVFSPMPGQPIEPDGIVSGMVVDQHTGDVYIAHTAFTDSAGHLVGGSDANGNDNAVVVDRFPGGYSASTVQPVPPTSISLCAPYNPGGPCQSDTAFHAPTVTSQGTAYSPVTVGQDFSPIAIDSAGDLYVVWAQAPTNPGTGQVDGPGAIYLAVSTNHGASWGRPINVSAAVPGLRTNVFPAVAAGRRGGVDIAWYGTTALGNCSTGCSSGQVSGSWNVYLTQILNAVTPAGAPNPRPTLHAVKVTEYPNHFGQICTMGIGCSTGGDRGLLDFLQVQVAPSGAAEVVWADAANTNQVGGTSSATIAFARQVSGPGLYGRSITGPRPAYGAAAGSPDAFYSANGTETVATPNLRILRSAVSGPNRAGDYVVTMTVANLSSLAASPALGGPDAVWLTRWELPTSHPSVAVQGHVFFAAMESDAGGAPSFYAGQTGTISTTHAKYLTYPPGVAVTGHYTPGAPGTITIDVPAADVGNPSGSALPLFSVTGLTATQSLPAAAGQAVFNQIDATAPYDVLPHRRGR